MTGDTADRLYNLLPGIYRIRDAEAGGPLRALLAIIGKEAGALEADIDGLYNNLFIETCDEWVVPYIGDLIGARILHAIPSADFSMRPYVAHTLAYRRRKGTATVLEQLACDITGWQARAVEYFRLCAMTQYLNHVRPDRHRLADLRDMEALDVLGGPFETTAHTADVRHISSGRGRFNIPDVGLFLWRLQSYPLTGSTAYKIDNHRYTFSPIGLEIPLFNNPRTELEISHIAEEINLPVELRKRALAKNPADYLAASEENDPAVSVYLDGNPDPVPPERIRVCDLDGWDVTGWQVPPFDPSVVDVVINPVLGRLCTLNTTNSVIVDYSYGFPGGIGGGPYNHLSAIASKDPVDDAEYETEIPGADIMYPVTLPAALSGWEAWNNLREHDTGGKGKPGKGIITISDSGTYAAGNNFIFEFSGSGPCSLIIQAADEQRPVLEGSVTLRGAGSHVSLTLSGLLIHGSITVESGALGSLTLTHCTLTPGGRLTPDGNPVSPEQPSLNYVRCDNDQSDILDVRLDHCITGAISLPADSCRLSVNDSIIQSFSRRNPVPVFVSRFTADLSDESGAVFISAFERDIRNTITPGTAFLYASVMIAGKLIVVIPVIDQVVPGDAIPGIQQALDSLVTTVPGVPSGTSGFLMTYAVIGSPFDIPPGDSARAMELNITARIAGTAGPGPQKITILPGEMNAAPKKPVWDLLEKAIRDAGITKASVSCFNGAIIAFCPADLPGGKPYEITFSATDTDHSSVYELGLAADSRIAISDDNVRPGPASSLDRATIFGEVRVKELDASGVIFNDIVMVEKNQEGCVRFSYVPGTSVTPKRYRCQPEYAVMRRDADRARVHQPLSDGEKAAIRARLVPQYTSTHYREPGYCQLGRGCAQEICTGGEDGSEMGAFSFLMQPQREANLRAALDEYLRFGLEAGIFYVT